MRPNARASSPISSRLLGVIGWSSLPSPTTAIAWVSSRIGRVSPREMIQDARRPAASVSAMMRMSVRPSPARISSSRA